MNLFDPDRVRAVFFDLDGTLIDPAEALGARLRARMHQLRLQRGPTSWLGQGNKAVADPLLAPGLSRLERMYDYLTQQPPYARTFRALRLERTLISLYSLSRRGRPYLPLAGAADVVRTLAAEYPLAVVTNRLPGDARLFLAQQNLSGYFQAIVGWADSPRMKPFPDPILTAAQRVGVPVENCLLVGDMIVDVRAARSAGAQAAAVLCGYGRRPELEAAGANLILEHTTALVESLYSSARRR